MTYQKWTDIFGAWEDHEEHMPMWDDVELRTPAPDRAGRRLTVAEARDCSVEFALETMQGYRSPSEHDDFHSPAEYIVQGILMELFVRDNRTAMAIERALRMLKRDAGEPTEYRLSTDTCEVAESVTYWPFTERCEGESVTKVVTLKGHKYVVCQKHWGDYLKEKVRIEAAAESVLDKAAIAMSHEDSAVNREDA